MRVKFTDVIKSPTPFMISGWWLDTPWKKPQNILTLLFRDGRGWLRWNFSHYDYVEPLLEDGSGPRFTATCAPPARRAWVRVAYLLRYRQWAETGLKDPDWPNDYLIGG